MTGELDDHHINRRVAVLVECHTLGQGGISPMQDHEDLVASDGTALVVMPRDAYERLASTLSLPGEVQADLMQGVSPLAAWRRYRGMSQSSLGRASGVHRMTVCRLEAAGAGAGNLGTRRKLAAVLVIIASEL